MSRPDPVARTLGASALAIAVWGAVCAFRGDERVVAWARTTVEDLFSQKQALQPRVDQAEESIRHMAGRLDTVDAYAEKWAERTNAIEGLVTDIGALWPGVGNERDGIVDVGRREVWERLIRLEDQLSKALVALDHMVVATPEVDGFAVRQSSAEDAEEHDALIDQLRRHPFLQPKMRHEIEKRPEAVAVAVLRRWLVALGDEERQPLPLDGDGSRLTRFQLIPDLMEHPALDSDERATLTQHGGPPPQTPILRDWWRRAHDFDHPPGDIWPAAAAWLEANRGLAAADLGRRETASKLDDHPHPSIRSGDRDGFLFDEINTPDHPANRTSAYR